MIRTIMMNRFMPLLGGLGKGMLLAASAGCKSTADRPDDTRKVIDEVKDETAAARANIQDKEEQLARGQGDAAKERGEFIAVTKKTLSDLDRRIQQLRADVQARSAEFQFEAGREIDQAMAELEDARRQAQSAFDRFRQTASDQPPEVRKKIEAAVQRTQAAYDALRGRMNNRDENPDMKGVDRAPAAPDPARKVELK